MSHAGLTRVPILFAKTLPEEDGLPGVIKREDALRAFARQ
jgi:hypothetical protein